MAMAATHAVRFDRPDTDIGSNGDLRAGILLLLGLCRDWK
jgi:hypothetical protein